MAVLSLSAKRLPVLQSDSDDLSKVRTGRPTASRHPLTSQNLISLYNSGDARVKDRIDWLSVAQTHTHTHIERERERERGKDVRSIVLCSCLYLTCRSFLSGTIRSRQEIYNRRVFNNVADVVLDTKRI